MKTKNFKYLLLVLVFLISANIAWQEQIMILKNQGFIKHNKIPLFWQYNLDLLVSLCIFSKIYEVNKTRIDPTYPALANFLENNKSNFKTIYKFK